MQLQQYSLTLSLSQVQVIADHLKKGVYSDVVLVLNEMAAQVARQENAAEQVKLQGEVQAAAASLPDPGPLELKAA